MHFSAKRFFTANYLPLLFSAKRFFLLLKYTRALFVIRGFAGGRLFDDGETERRLETRAAPGIPPRLPHPNRQRRMEQFPPRPEEYGWSAAQYGRHPETRQNGTQGRFMAGLVAHTCLSNKLLEQAQGTSMAPISALPESSSKERLGFCAHTDGLQKNLLF